MSILEEFDNIKKSAENLEDLLSEPEILIHPTIRTCHLCGNLVELGADYERGHKNSCKLIYID